MCLQETVAAFKDFSASNAAGAAQKKKAAPKKAPKTEAAPAATPSKKESPPQKPLQQQQQQQGKPKQPSGMGMTLPHACQAHVAVQCLHRRELEHQGCGEGECHCEQGPVE